MGCDIHVFTEAYNTVDIDKKAWVNIDRWKLNRFYDPKEPDGEDEYEIDALYSGRDYGLFSLLAGVRDYTGKVVPISEPKGLPDDISARTQQEAERWGSDGHSHSYITLKELKDYIKTNPPLHKSGLITRKQARELDNDGITPDSWCQGSTDKTLVFREWVQNENRLGVIADLLEKRLRDEFWIFGETYDPKLEEDIRIVFWFDN
jgi:hypothetical protein